MTAPPSGGTRLELLLRSRPARWAGLLCGLVALGLLVVALSSELSGGDSLEGARPAPLAVTFAGFLLFHAGAIGSLKALGGSPAPQLWAASQLAKYLPAPGAALAGLVHSAVVRGGSARSAVGLMLRHSAVLLSGALLVGSPAVSRATVHHWGLPGWLAPMLLAIAAAALAVGVTRGLEPAALGTALAWSVTAWAALGLACWAGVAEGDGEALTVAAAFSAAWVVGFLALPVPAGIGVREAVLYLFLEPSLGPAGALSFAVLTRLVHIASDAVVAVAFLGISRAVARRDRRVT